MSENKFEKVSSLVDGYQTEDRAIEDISKDEELSDTWSRYQLIGDVLRKDVPDNLQFDISTNIAEIIDQEPTILAPKKPSSGNTISTIKAKVVQFAKPFGQVAIAASAAGLMVLGVQQQNIVNEESTSPTQTFQTTPFGGVAEPVSFNYQQADRASQKQAYIQQQRRFQALLADHQQQIKLHAQSSTVATDMTEADKKPLQDKDHAQ